MRISTTPIALLALPSLIHAVKLSDMKPQAEDLPPKCDSVYRTSINGCEPTDFQTRSCSDACLSALDTLTDDLKDACGSEGLQGQNLVIAFLAGVGPSQICRNAKPSGGNSGSSGGGSSGGRSGEQDSTSTVRGGSSTRTVSTTSTITVRPDRDLSSESPEPERSTTTSGGLIVDASSSPSTANDAPAATGSADDAEEANEDGWQDDSGGGSPFDSQGNLGAGSGVSVSGVTLLACVFTALFAAVR